MSSSINYNVINENYPIAGVDNNTQGFRDNFASIKTALETAATEISALQLSSADTTTSTNFGGNLIQSAVLQDISLLAVNASPSSSSVNVDYSAGSYHTYNITTNTSFTIISWPESGNYGSIRLAVKNLTTSSKTITFDPGLGSLKKEASLTLPFSTSTTGTFVFDTWTVDSGNTIFVKFIGGPFV